MPSKRTHAKRWTRSRRFFVLGHFLSEPQLTNIRAALSWPFNDLPVEYDYVAAEVRGIDPDVLYEILYSEVAPVCFTNLLAAVPLGMDWLRSRLTQNHDRAKAGSQGEQLVSQAIR